MKTLFVILLSILCVRTAYGQSFDNVSEDKTAILMVHFGTTFDDTRKLTIDAINDKVHEEFPGIKVVEAYTSRIIIDRLKKRGISRLTPQQALLRLAADGYTHVIVQGTNVIDGIEAEVLRKEADRMAPFFTEIRVGRPLLYSVEDCLEVVSVLTERYGKDRRKDIAVVLVGHGTSTPAGAIYSQMDYMFTSAGAPHFYVATVEGYPDYATTLSRLKSTGVKKVLLAPFMFVAGDHARNDIDSEWREQLVGEGFSVTTVLEGLGQIPGIQNLYIKHLREAFEAPVLDAERQKSTYVKENL